MDTASSNPKFNWDSADLVGEWKAFRQHVEFMFKGPLRAKNEEERCCYLMLWVGEKGRRIFSTWDMTEAQQKVLQEYTMIGSRPTYNPSQTQFLQDTNCTARFKNQVRLSNSS